MIRFRLSGLNSWHDCQRRVAAGSFVDQIQGLKDILNKENNQIGSSVGTASHAGVESLLQAKLDGKRISLRDSQEFGVETLKEQLNKFNGVVEMDNETSNINEAINQVAQIVKIYEKFVLPHREPRIIEERFNFVRGNIEFSGQIDLQTMDLSISDLKTSKKLGVYFPQQGAYSLAIKENGHEVGEVCEIIHIPRLKLKKEPFVQAVQYNTSNCERVAKTYMKQVEVLYEMFLEDNNPDIFKANPSSTICSEKYCRAYGTEFCSITKVVPKVYEMGINVEGLL